MNETATEFGSLVFNDDVMHERLPKDTYEAMKKTINEGKDLDLSVANVVANAMKDWATEHGATHYTHWFQPMTGVTAEKHESFIAPSQGGRVIMEFSGKELIKGEPDASSFPSGGLRATFEARGYTAWDPTSYAFIKDGVLCIPTAFASYSGEALDKKTPLLRSMEALDRQAMRILRLFGNEDASRVVATVGAEQEYFLIDKSVYEQRRDLKYTNRTLFGARPPKGQELDDHYFGAIRPRVSAFMAELDHELWKLGITAKTKHNEVAPAQHELAPVFTQTNVASDHNQVTMEMMKRIALKHGMVCLLHEKPFAGINGSGKHNNWSIQTDTGENLLNPTRHPSNNLQFLLILSAVIAAVDEHQDLLRISVASAGNDHRLGANEAPPAIISMFLGDELTEVLEAIASREDREDSRGEIMDMGVRALPNFRKDNTDRNRTSPFAFTGNKFEFRMLGSALSISGPNVVLNTIVADQLKQFADRLERANEFEAEVLRIVRETYARHNRIIFNGNNYSDEWVDEAERRGLLNLRSTADCLPYFVDPKNVELFERHGVLSETEMHSRVEILLENYCRTIDIEAVTMLQMAKKSIVPAVCTYIRELAETASLTKSVAPEASTETERQLITELSALLTSFQHSVDTLDEKILEAHSIEDNEEAARFYRNEVFAAMQDMRGISDTMEAVVSKKCWPWPTYGDILFSV